MSESVLPTFSSRCFIVSGLKFRSLIHFDTDIKNRLLDSVGEHEGRMI